MVKLISVINFSVKKRNFENDQWWNNLIVVNIKLINLVAEFQSIIW